MATGSARGVETALDLTDEILGAYRDVIADRVLPRGRDIARDVLAPMAAANLEIVED